MSDCGICLYADDSMSAEFFHKKNVRGRKEYKCYECGKPIAKGAVHQYASGKSEGEFWDARTCLICAEIRKTFSCSYEMYGNLWDEMDYVFPEMTTGCLNRLQTPEAKKELLRRWNEWKFAQ